MSKAVATLFLLVGMATSAMVTAQPAATGALTYQTPPEPIAGALEAPGPPFILPSPGRDQIAVLEQPGLPSIAALAEPELGLAGLTINPRNNGPSRSSAYSNIRFINVATGEERRAELPAEARLISPQWSPNGRHLAVLLLSEDDVELLTVSAATGEVQRRAASVNAAFPVPYSWFADGSALLVRLVPEGRSPQTSAAGAVNGPVVHETSGEAAPSGTIQNLLANAEDEAHFENYFTSRLAVVRVDGGSPRLLGEPGLIVQATPSPDGRFILERRLKRPFSYSLPASAFPEEVSVLDLAGTRLRMITDRASPLASPSQTPTGPRAVRWRADAPATLFWAQTNGNGAGDQLYLLAAPFQGMAIRFAELPIRFQNIHWAGARGALATGLSTEARAEQRMIVDPSGGREPRLLQQRSLRGGADVGSILEWGDDLLHLTLDGEAMMVRLRDGLGRVSLRSGAMSRLWSERAGERLFVPLDRQAQRLLSWREDVDSPPNLFVVERNGGRGRRLTEFQDPLPQYARMQSQRISYRRGDGRELAGTLHLPDEYDPRRDGALPVLIWAYPASRSGDGRSIPEAAPDMAFVRPTGFDDLPLLLTARGYAVFEADMPIFGSDSSPPNDTHVPQLVANAEAAIARLTEIGVASRDRVAIGGHSYGAAMAANLLAHSDLFRTGIALSGAYNRTLTPFGFQASERRSFWEAPEAYLAMSPFVHADQINEPILLVHGAADNNSGTLPMQSERLYSALRGLGGKARFVLLPFEGHQYRARESLMHLMWEMDRWLRIHLQERAGE